MNVLDNKLTYTFKNIIQFYYLLRSILFWSPRAELIAILSATSK
jgi:hypothetical protein